uniref:Uncharacterized protein C9orf57 homolog isoform X1 n=1 Tax=Phascolarctos cinereus TaxID=38626 RepID=A0A6P5LI62_PHACI|nr:uncharacterized protein C9orf57 homolog isoform X1 [Phascolarctos cinereus]
MVRIIFSVIIMLFFLQADGTEIICRYCNLSLPFHGCLLDGGTCRVDPGQYCKVEYHEQAFRFLSSSLIPISCLPRTIFLHSERRNIRDQMFLIYSTISFYPIAYKTLSLLGWPYFS